MQDRKACPNNYSDVSQVSPEEVPRQNKTVLVNILVASFGLRVGSFSITPNG